MENNLQNNSYEKFLKDGELAISNEIEKFIEMGFDIDKRKTIGSNIELFRALLIDPTEKIARVERINITPNDDYNFDYFIESHELESDNRKAVLPFLVNYSTFEAGLDSDKLSKEELSQIKNSPAYKMTIGKEPEKI